MNAPGKEQFEAIVRIFSGGKLLPWSEFCFLPSRYARLYEIALLPRPYAVAVVMEMSTKTSETRTGGFPRYQSRATQVKNEKPIVFNVIDEFRILEPLNTKRRCIVVAAPFAYKDDDFGVCMIYVKIAHHAQVAVIDP